MGGKRSIWYNSMTSADIYDDNNQQIAEAIWSSGDTWSSDDTGWHLYPEDCPHSTEILQALNELSGVY